MGACGGIQTTLPPTEIPTPPLPTGVPTPPQPTAKPPTPGNVNYIVIHFSPFMATVPIIAVVIFVIIIVVAFLFFIRCLSKCSLQSRCDN